MLHKYYLLLKPLYLQYIMQSNIFCIIGVSINFISKKISQIDASNNKGWKQWNEGELPK